MSVRITLRCDREFREGTCPAETHVHGVDTVDRARRVAAGAGWSHNTAGDRCPACNSPRWYRPVPLFLDGSAVPPVGPTNR